MYNVYIYIGTYNTCEGASTEAITAEDIVSVLLPTPVYILIHSKAYLWKVLVKEHVCVLLLRV